MRTRVFTIALIGPDGTGKSTISRMLQDLLPVPTKNIYMGINQAASNFVLPTTVLWKKIKRLSGRQVDMGGPPDPSRIQPVTKNPLKRIARELKSGLWIANLIAEEWFRQCVTWYYMFRGYVVIFDRHFYFDYYKYHIANSGGRRTLSERWHGFMLNHIFPKPDLVIFLDAPAEVLFARKSEGTVELLEQRRQEYLQFQGLVKRFVTVDTTHPVDEVARQVSSVIMDFHLLKNGTRDVLSKPEIK
jgi:thymidylate kinase